MTLISQGQQSTIRHVCIHSNAIDPPPYNAVAVREGFQIFKWYIIKTDFRLHKHYLKENEQK